MFNIGAIEALVILGVVLVVLVGVIAQGVRLGNGTKRAND
jgi:hypothetical protein